MSSEQSEKAKRYTYNLLRIRPRSEKELILRLRKKGFSEKTVNDVVSFLKKEELINDLEFAKEWVDSRLRTTPKGKTLLKEELAAKGISPSIIDKTLSEKMQDEEKIAKDIAEEKLKALKGLPQIKIKRKLFDYLRRRGFEEETVENIINSLVLKGFFDE